MWFATKYNKKVMYMQKTVALIGAGRMGSVVAKQLPEETRKIIIDTETEKAKLLADKVGGTFSSSYDAVSDADLIAIVLPAPAVNATVEMLIGLAKTGAVIINMSTSANIDPIIKSKDPTLQIIDTKIIGHATSMSKGEPGIVVVETQDEAAFNMIKSQLPGFQQVARGNADLVPTINEIGTVEAIRIAVNVRKQLRTLNIPEEWITVVIKTICAGVVKSFAENDLGNFALELVRKLEQEDT
jgi:6-phosphogluconate dehydrogenase (decarboxylating)